MLDRREDGGGLASLPEIPRRLQEMAGVVGRRRSGQEHAVIGGALGFHTQAPHCPPRKRMGPIESARQMSEHLHGPILASDVSQLVEKEGTTPIRRPIDRVRRKHDRRLPETMDDRDPHGVAHQETDGAPQPQRPGRIGDLALPVRLGHFRGAPQRPLGEK